MKIKKAELKAMLACAVEGMQEVDPDVLESLVKELLKHRKRHKAQRELRLQCGEFRDYLQGEEVCEDGVAKRYGNIGDEAVTALMGQEFVDELNAKL